MLCTSGHDLYCIPYALIHAIVVTVEITLECEMVLHIGQVPVLVFVDNGGSGENVPLSTS